MKTLKLSSELNKALKSICKAFNLGNLKSYITEANDPVKGFNTAYFNTSKETNLKYHYKN